MTAMPAASKDRIPHLCAEKGRWR